MISPILDHRPPRVDIVMAVLESARDAGAIEYVEICVRLLAANRKGWRAHADKGDWKAVLEAYEEVCLSNRNNRPAE
jgi:hypothetical protein